MQPELSTAPPESSAAARLEAAKRRPATLWAVLVISGLRLLFSLGWIAGLFHIAVQAETVGLTPFYEGFLEALGYDPSTYRLEDAAYETGHMCVSLVVILAYPVGVLQRWRNALFVVLAFDAVSLLAQNPCGLVMVGLLAVLILNRRAQDHLRT